jgi:hypothetical protein
MICSHGIGGINGLDRRLTAHQQSKVISANQQLYATFWENLNAVDDTFVTVMCILNMAAAKSKAVYSSAIFIFSYLSTLKVISTCSTEPIGQREKQGTADEMLITHVLIWYTARASFNAFGVQGASMLPLCALGRLRP